MIPMTILAKELVGLLGIIATALIAFARHYMKTVKRVSNLEATSEREVSLSNERFDQIEKNLQELKLGQQKFNEGSTEGYMKLLDAISETSIAIARIEERLRGKGK